MLFPQSHAGHVHVHFGLLEVVHGQDEEAELVEFEFAADVEGADEVALLGEAGGGEVYA